MRARHVGQSVIIRICDDSKELLDTVASDRRNSPKLGKMRADRVDHRDLLTDE